MVNVDGINTIKSVDESKIARVDEKSEEINTKQEILPDCPQEKYVSKPNYSFPSNSEKKMLMQKKLIKLCIDKKLKPQIKKKNK